MNNIVNRQVFIELIIYTLTIIAIIIVFIFPFQNRYEHFQTIGDEQFIENFFNPTTL